MIRLITEYQRAIAMAAVRGLQTMDEIMGKHEKPIRYPTVAGNYMMAGNVDKETMWAVAEQLEITGADLVDYSDMTPKQVEELRAAASSIAAEIRTQYGQSELMEDAVTKEREVWDVGE